MRVLIYKDEVLDALKTCLDTDVIPYDKEKNYIRYEQAVYEINKLQDKVSCSEIPNNSDIISRQDAIDALWKALYEYEDKTEKQFLESEELDVDKWMVHRIFVQNMNDIDRQTILNLPSVQPEQIPEYSTWSRISETLVDESKGHITPEQAIRKIREYLRMMEKPERKKGKWITETINSYTKRTYCSLCDEEAPFIFKKDDKYNYWYHESKLTNFCPNCGADMQGGQDEN